MAPSESALRATRDRLEELEAEARTAEAEGDSQLADRLDEEADRLRQQLRN